jgi:PQQ-dependent catabolism-associated beta-propeller protein
MICIPLSLESTHCFLRGPARFGNALSQLVEHQKMGYTFNNMAHTSHLKSSPLIPSRQLSEPSKINSLQNPMLLHAESHLLRPTRSTGVLLGLALVCAAFPLWADTAYVTLEDERAIAQVSIPEGKLIKRIPVGKRPRGIGIDPVGQHLFVAVSDEDTIKSFDLPKPHTATKLPSGKDPETFAVSPDGHQLFVSNENDNAVTVIDLSHRKQIKSIPVGVEPEGIAASPDGRWIASTSETTNMVHWIDRGKLDLIDNTLVDPRPRACRFTADSEELWVSSEIAGTVTVLDSTSRARKATISFQIPGVTREKIQPVGIQIDRNRQWAYVALGPSNRVAVVDAKTFKVIEYLLVGQRVWNLAFDSQEKYLITANGNSNDISIVDLASRKVLRSVAVGQGPWGVVVTP